MKAQWRGKKKVHEKLYYMMLYVFDIFVNFRNASAFGFVGFILFDKSPG